MAETSSFGSWVRHRRRELDLTQEELAHRVGCARITIRKIEAEQLRPSKQMAHVLGLRLGISPQELEDFLRFARGGSTIAPAPASPPRSNLPQQLTSFVGRESEAAQVRELLQRSRMVTLTGSGGTGKTRLALEVAGGLIQEFAHGVWLIELAGLSKPTQVVNSIASALGVLDEQGRPLMATVVDWLRNRRLLLILDNCEHVISACAEFADAALRAGRDPHILATSRETLRIAGETSYRVPSLVCPEPSQAHRLPIEEVRAYPAVRLFGERATQALSTFRVTPDNVADIAEICHRLDGIPLAIELAAVRVKTVHIQEIAARLDDRFQLLTDGSRTALPRHQTLRSLIDWSHNLLSKAERAVLRRLSVFAGGWTLEAAEAVCAGNEVERREVLSLLTHLADKSLISFDDRGAVPRYRMLETIREYARDRLLEAEEHGGTCDQHLRFFLTLSERTRPKLESAERAEWLPRLEMEHDNLLAALEWASERNADTARLLAGILERFWFYGAHLSEARSWYERVLERSDDAPVTRGLAMGVLGSGCVEFNLELMDAAQRALERSVELWRQLDDPPGLAWALGWLAYLLLQRGEAARAHAIYTEHEPLFRAHGNGLTVVWVLSSWGAAKSVMRPDDPSAKVLLDEALTVAHTLQDPFGFEMCYSSLGDWAMTQGDVAAARSYFVEALQWRRQLGTRWIIAAGLWQVASIMRLGGDYVQAEPMYAEALEMARELGDQRSEAHAAQELGAVAIHLGHAERATALLTESLASYRKWADPLGIARCILGFADLQHHEEQIERAARLLGFMTHWLQSHQVQLVHFDRANYERLAAAARSQLGEAAFSAECEAGGQLSLEDAISLSVDYG